MSSACFRLLLLALTQVRSRSRGAAALPALSIDPSGITVSGISSGADFAVMLHVAHSSIIKGVGVFAGQAYHCAVTRFARDRLLPMWRRHNELRVPVCEGCPANTTLEYDHCKSYPERTDVDKLVAYAQEQSSKGTIDDVRNLWAHPLFFFRGKKDTCYKSGAVEATRTFYSRLNSGVRVRFEASVSSNHAQPTVSFGAPCGGRADARYSYVEACSFDGAGAVLQHLYGGRLTQPVGPADNASLLTFAQNLFWVKASRPELKNANLPADGSAGTSSRAYAYVPVRCRKEFPGSRPCRLHLYHHGCGGLWGSTFLKGVSHHAGPFGQRRSAQDAP